MYRCLSISFQFQIVCTFLYYLSFPLVLASRICVMFIRKQTNNKIHKLFWFCFCLVLDSRLRNIIGFLPSTDRLYGIMSNSPSSYAASDSPHSSWYLIPKSEYDDAASSDGFVTVVEVPFVSTANFEFSDPNDYTNSLYTNSAFIQWKGEISFNISSPPPPHFKNTKFLKGFESVHSGVLCQCLGNGIHRISLWQRARILITPGNIIGVHSSPKHTHNITTYLPLRIRKMI